MNKKMMKQLLKEFSLPLIFAIVWIFLEVDNSPWLSTVKGKLQGFSAVFFFLSWIGAQYFRVKKQTAVEDSFNTLDTKINKMMGDVEVTTARMLAQLTGGDSFPCLSLGMFNSAVDQCVVTLISNGAYPLYDLNVRIVDIQKFNAIAPNITFQSISSTTSTFQVGNLNQNSAIILQQAWQLNHTPVQSYNAFFIARNGNFTQIIRLVKQNGTWIVATKVEDQNNKILFEQVDPNFPRNASMQVVW
jgi:hypothetical protein